MNFFFLLAFSLVKVLIVECDELLFVQAVWRHGDRTPTGTWPNDPYNETYWLQNGFQGWGQLTQMGMEQHYELGKKLRERYITNLAFLSPTYKSQEIYIKSTDYNRTVISAYSNLIGMFEAGEENQTGIDYPQNPKWPKGFVPIAVHTGTIGPLNCQREDELAQLLAKTPEIQNFLNNQTYQENKEKIENLTEWKKDLDLPTVMDTLNIEHNVYNLSNVDPELVKMLPFLNQTVDNLIRWTNGWDIKPYQGVNFSTEIPKVRNGGGSFVWNFLGLVNEKIRCKLNSTDSTDLCKWINHLKYYAYSGHDSTLEALFSTLGFRKSAYDEDGMPRYSTGLTLELWLDASNSSYIKVLYWPLNEAYEDVTIHVTGCVENCPLEMFINRSMPYKVDDYEEWCNAPLFEASTSTVLPTSPNHPNSSSYVQFSITLSMFLLFFVMFVNL